MGLLDIHRNIREIIIKQTENIKLFSIFKYIFFIFFTFFIVKPMDPVILANLNLNNQIYSDPIGQQLMLFVLVCYFYIIYLTGSLFKYLFRESHFSFISIDPDSRQISFKSGFFFLVNIFRKEDTKLTMPILNLESLKIASEPVEFKKGQEIFNKDILFLTISSSNWSGNEEYLEKNSSKVEKMRLKLIKSYNMDSELLNGIKNC